MALDDRPRFISASAGSECFDGVRGADVICAALVASYNGNILYVPWIKAAVSWLMLGAMACSFFLHAMLRRSGLLRSTFLR
jgi:hypothetical protein